MKRLTEYFIFGFWFLLMLSAEAVSTSFFNAAQTKTEVSSSINSVTIQSGAYRFTYSVDGYWSAVPGGPPTGRFFTVLWPAGVQAQTITTGPLVGTGANITIKRADGNPFDLQSFTGKILLNTAGAGAAFEIMPLVGGEDAFADPLQYNCSGYAGQSFSYTPSLVGYDTYKIHMWGDFALTALTLVDASAPPTHTVSAGVSPAGAGTVDGAGVYEEGTDCTLTAAANAGWIFSKWTEGGADVGVSASYQFTVGGNRVLTAVFSPALPPVASGGTFYQLSGQPLTISVHDLMTFDYSQNGGNVWFVSASAATDNGLPLTVDVNAMQIHVPANTVADQFTYTIEDDFGTTATGTAVISLIDKVTGRATGLDLTSVPGTAIVSFSGVPWYTYTVQRCTDLGFSGPSLQTWSVQAWSDGSITIYDDFTGLGANPDRAFYRMACP